MKFFRSKLSAFIASMLLFFSTGAFAIDMHFCGDHLVDLGFFDEDARCGMLLPGQEGACPMSFMDCCEDTKFAQAGADDVYAVDIIPELSQIEDDFVHRGYTFWTSFDPNGEAELIQYYVPPDLFRDVQVLYEQFLL